jgi:Putative transposase DNA-binding domain
VKSIMEKRFCRVCQRELMRLFKKEFKQELSDIDDLRAPLYCQNKQDMPLNKRICDCSSCNVSIDRDLNASKNILAAGMSVLKLVDGDDIGLPDEARIVDLKADEVQCLRNYLAENNKVKTCLRRFSEIIIIYLLQNSVHNFNENE